MHPSSTLKVQFLTRLSKYLTMQVYGRVEGGGAWVVNKVSAEKGERLWGGDQTIYEWPLNLLSVTNAVDLVPSSSPFSEA